MEKVKIAIVEDNRTARNRLAQRLKIRPELNLILACGSAEECFDFLNEKSDSQFPDVILMDIGLPGMNGIEATVILKEHYPNLEVVMLTVFEEEDKIFKSIQAGASGYLLKDDIIERYLDTISALAEGGAPLSPTIAQKMLSYMRYNDDKGSKSQKTLNPKTNASSIQPFLLTSRELDILEGIVSDDTEALIADKHHISPHTVRTHIKNIYKKLQVHSRAAAVRVARENNLLNG